MMTVCMIPETVDVGSAAAVVVGLAHVVPVREEPAWLQRVAVAVSGGHGAA